MRPHKVDLGDAPHNVWARGQKAPPVDSDADLADGERDAPLKAARLGDPEVAEDDALCKAHADAAERHLPVDVGRELSERDATQVLSQSSAGSVPLEQEACDRQDDRHGERGTQRGRAPPHPTFGPPRPRAGQRAPLRTMTGICRRPPSTQRVAQRVEARAGPGAESEAWSRGRLLISSTTTSVFFSPPSNLEMASPRSRIAVAPGPTPAGPGTSGAGNIAPPPRTMSIATPSGKSTGTGSSMSCVAAASRNGRKVTCTRKGW